MRNQTITKPAQGTASNYMQGYVDEVMENDLIAAFESALDDAMNIYLSVEEYRADFSYEAGKWTIKEVIAHVIDTERIFAYRALTIARGDRTPLPGFDEDAYVPHSNAPSRSIPELVHEYELVRRSTIALYESFADEMLDREGTANNTPATPRILGYMIAGHDIHHLEVVRKKYLNAAIS